jgi:hypothetical protein
VHVRKKEISLSRLRSWAFLLAMLCTIPLSIGCTRTVTVEKPVEVRVPVPVQVRTVCPLSLPDLPPQPRRGDPVLCQKSFGQGAVCFEPSEAVRQARLMGMLVDLYLDRVACGSTEPAPPAAQ